MVTLNLRGYEIEYIPVKDSHNRRALQFKNQIYQTLKELGLTENDMDVNMEPMALAKKEAWASWFLDGRHHYYSCSRFRFADNMMIVHRVLSLAVADVMSGKKTVEQFSEDFQEDKEIQEKRREAREYFGLEPNFTMEEVNLKYRTLSKGLHPDMPGGDVDKFKKLNEAHKILKREFN